MTNRSKETIKDWIDSHDRAMPLETLNQKQRAERMLTIKAYIQLCNDLEKSNIYDKMKVMYPMSIPNQSIRSMPINFKK